MAVILTPSQRLTLFLNRAREWRDYLIQTKVTMAEGPISGTCIANFIARVDSARTVFVDLAASDAPAITYIQEQLNVPGFDIVRRANDIVAAIDAALAEIDIMVPSTDEGGYTWLHLFRRDLVNGGGAWRRLLPADTLMLRLRYQSIIDLLPEVDPRV